MLFTMFFQRKRTNPFGLFAKESKIQLKKTLENLNNKELRYYHWFLRSADKFGGGFKPIRRRRLQHANGLDTVDLMLQTYPKNVQKVTKKMMEEVNIRKNNVITSFMAPISYINQFL